MPGALLARVRALDTDDWRVATRALPVVFQGVVATLWGLGLLLVRWPLGHAAPFPVVLSAAAVATLVVSLLLGAALACSGSGRRRGCGMAIAGSGITAAAMALSYAAVVVPIMAAL